MSLPPPPAQAPTSRPGTATTGAILAILMSSLGVFISVLAVIVVAVSADDGDPAGRRAAGVVFGVLLVVGLVGLTSAVMTLRNSNRWRITTIVLGFVVGAGWAFIALGAFLSNDRGSTAGGIFLLLLAVISIASPVLLLANGAQAFYAGTSSPGRDAPTGASPAPTLPPAGWYPTEGSLLRWWNGSEWTAHVHDGSQS